MFYIFILAVIIWPFRFTLRFDTSPWNLTSTIEVDEIKLWNSIKNDQHQHLLACTVPIGDTDSDLLSDLLYELIYNRNSARARPLWLDKMPNKLWYTTCICHVKTWWRLVVDITTIVNQPITSTTFYLSHVLSHTYPAHAVNKLKLKLGKKIQLFPICPVRCWTKVRKMYWETSNAPTLPRRRR